MKTTKYFPCKDFPPYSTHNRLQLQPIHQTSPQQCSDHQGTRQAWLWDNIILLLFTEPQNPFPTRKAHQQDTSTSCQGALSEWTGEDRCGLGTERILRLKRNDRETQYGPGIDIPFHPTARPLPPLQYMHTTLVCVVSHRRHVLSEVSHENHYSPVDSSGQLSWVTLLHLPHTQRTDKSRNLTMWAGTQTQSH